MSNFLAKMFRMKYIDRWSLMKNTTKENVLEHSATTAMIANMLGLISNIELGKLTTLALYHDASEVITGDIPTPVKYHTEQLRSDFKYVENLAIGSLVDDLEDKYKDYYESILKNDWDPYILKLIKAADKLSAYIKCLEEIKAGNNEFVKAAESIRKSLDAMCLASVPIFMEKYLDSFTKTLDEISF